jgi:hypothetical protein
MRKEAGGLINWASGKPPISAVKGAYRFGNTFIDPSAGKKAVPPPYDPKGRKDLFQVLNQAELAPASSDSWMGHTLIDPGKGKKSCPGPEQRLGRNNLFPLLQNVRCLRLRTWRCTAGPSSTWLESCTMLTTAW